MLLQLPHIPYCFWHLKGNTSFQYLKRTSVDMNIALDYTDLALNKLERMEDNYEAELHKHFPHVKRQHLTLAHFTVVQVIFTLFTSHLCNKSDVRQVPGRPPRALRTCHPHHNKHPQKLQTHSCGCMPKCCFLLKRKSHLKPTRRTGWKRNGTSGKPWWLP